MKVLHWAFILVAIILPFSIICRNTVNSRYAALKDEVRINNAIDTATKDAIDQIIAVSGFDFDNEFGDVINITPELAQETVNTFFHTLGVNYNIPYKMSDATELNANSSDSYIKNYFAPYVPAVAVLAYDGFYIYSQELTSDGYEYKLSSKIPYTYESKDGSYSIGYTLGDDIYLYYDGKCYSGRVNGNSLRDVENEYLKTVFDEEGNPLGYSAEEISYISNDISVIMYALSNERVGLDFENNILPASSDTNFLQDYSKKADGTYLDAGAFHKNRRKVIIDVITSCLNEEFNEHNRFADLVGNTYEFALPEITNDDWINTINDISVMAFVQGIPMGTLDGTYYNNFALGGSKIVKKDWIYGSTYNSHKLYHNSGCELISDDNYEVIFNNQEDAAAAGYYPCLKCN